MFQFYSLTNWDIWNATIQRSYISFKKVINFGRFEMGYLITVLKLLLLLCFKI